MPDSVDPTPPTSTLDLSLKNARTIIARRMIELGRAPECSCHPVGGHPPTRASARTAGAH